MGIYEKAHKTIMDTSALILLEKAKTFEPDKYQILKDVHDIKQKIEMQQSLAEGYQLVSALQATAHLKGDIAELGSFKGGSAKLILKHKQKDKKLHLFDTWEGIPDNKEGFSKEQFKTDFDQVKAFVGEGAIYHKGFFPDTATEETNNANYSFVHLDGDIQQSIYDGLAYFYPRLVPGGIIIIHDWGLMGVKMGFLAYFGMRQPMTFCHGTQAMVVK